MKLLGKTFVVTGGGSGLGRQLVLLLAQKGVQVAAVDINSEALQETVRQAEGYTGEVLPLVCNITDKEQVLQLPKLVLEQYGKVDGLINNAGIIQPFVTVDEMDDQLIHRLFDINFFGTLNMVCAFLPLLKQSEEANLSNVASLGGFVPISGQTIYGASKAAVKQLTDGLRAELEHAHVHVTSIVPGAMATAIRQNSGLGAVDVDKQKTKAVALTPTNALQLLAQVKPGDSVRVDNNEYRFLQWQPCRVRH